MSHNAATILKKEPYEATGFKLDMMSSGCTAVNTYPAYLISYHRNSYNQSFRKFRYVLILNNLD